jgi:hypothetical protein
MAYLFGILILLNTFLSKMGFSVKFLPFHINVVDVVYVVLLAYFAIKFWKYRIKLLTLFYPLFILFAWGIVSSMIGYIKYAETSAIVEEFLRQYVYIFTAIMAFLMLTDHSSGERNKNVILFFYFLGIGLLAIYGVLEGILGKKFILYTKNILLALGYPKDANFFMAYEDNSTKYGRIITTLLSWNSSGAYLGSSAMMLLSRAFLDKNAKYKILYILISVLATLGVILSGSRASWIGFLLTMSLVGMVALGKKFYFLLIPYILLFSVLVVSNYMVYSRIKSFLSLQQDGSAMGRLIAIKSSIAVIKNSPFVGHGLGMYSTKKIPASHEMYAGLDCFYVKYVVSNGIIGLFIFLWAIFWLFKKVVEKNRYKFMSRLREKWLLTGSICGLLFLLVVSLFDSMLTVSTYMNTLFWLYFGIALSESRYEQR